MDECDLRLSKQPKKPHLNQAYLSDLSCSSCDAFRLGPIISNSWICWSRQYFETSIRLWSSRSFSSRSQGLLGFCGFLFVKVSVPPPRGSSPTECLYSSGSGGLPGGCSSPPGRYGFGAGGGGAPILETRGCWFVGGGKYRLGGILYRWFARSVKKEEKKWN